MSLEPSAHESTTLPPLHTTSLLSPNMASKRAQGWHVVSQRRGSGGAGESRRGKALVGSPQHGSHPDADRTMARRSSVQFVETNGQDSTPDRLGTRRTSLLASSPRHAHFGNVTTITEDTPRLAGSPTARTTAALHDTKAFRQSMADFLNVMYGSTTGSGEVTVTSSGGEGTVHAPHTLPGDTDKAHDSSNNVSSNKDPASGVVPPVVGAPHPIHKWKTTMHLSDTAAAVRQRPPATGGTGDTVAGTTALAVTHPRRGWTTTRTAPPPRSQPREDNIDTLVDHFVRALSRQTTMGATVKDTPLPPRSRRGGDGAPATVHGEGHEGDALDEGMTPLYPNTGRTMASRMLSHRHNTRGPATGGNPQQEVSMFVSQAMDSFFGAGPLHLSRGTASSTKSVLSSVWHDPNFARLLSFNTRSNLGPATLDGVDDEDAAATTVLQPMYIGAQAVFRPVESRSQVSLSHRSEMMCGRIPPLSVVDGDGGGNDRGKDELDEAFVLPSTNGDADDVHDTSPRATPSASSRNAVQALHNDEPPHRRGSARATNGAPQPPASPRKGETGRLEAQFASLNSNLFQKSSAEAAEDSWAEVDAQMRAPVASDATAKGSRRPSPRGARGGSASRGGSARRTSSRHTTMSALPAVTSSQTPTAPQTASREPARAALGDALYRKLAEEEALSRNVMVAVERQLRAYIKTISAERVDDKLAGRPPVASHTLTKSRG